MRFQRAIQIFFVCFKGKKNFYPKRLGWKIRFSIFCFDSIFNVRIFTVLIYCGSSHAENTLFYEHKIEQKKYQQCLLSKITFDYFIQNKENSCNRDDNIFSVLCVNKLLHKPINLKVHCSMEGNTKC